MPSIKLNMKFASFADICKLAEKHPLPSLGFRLRPQLAYDPKIGTSDLSLVYDYAKTAMSSDWFYAEPKLDGVRGQFVITYDKVSNSIAACCISRAGRVIDSVPHLLAQLINDKALAFMQKHCADGAGTRLVIDSELLCRPRGWDYDRDYAKNPWATAEFRYINGLTNRRTPDSETARLFAYCFQYYLADLNGDDVYTFSHLECSHIVQQLGLEPEWWWDAPSLTIKSTSDLKEQVDYFASRHVEGLVLKSPDYRHHPCRTKHWLKLKFRKRGTYRLVDVIYGEGKCLGTCGAIQVKDALGQTTLVGTGMTDAERDELAQLDLSNNRYYVDISYMTKTGTSLREPVYEGLRYDLTNTDTIVDLFEQR